jgi:hypothetical protein
MLMAHKILNQGKRGRKRACDSVDKIIELNLRKNHMYDMKRGKGKNDALQVSPKTKCTSDSIDDSSFSAGASTATSPVQLKNSSNKCYVFTSLIS